MRPGPLAASALAACICLAYGARAQAQEPVPVGERTPPGGVARDATRPRVVLRGSDGRVLASASVVVRNVGTNERVVIETTATGQASLPPLPPGRYEVTTHAPGRPAFTRTVTIPTGGTALALFSGGPVPAAEPVPDPSPGPTPVSAPVPDGEIATSSAVACSVEEMTFTDDVSLQTWLEGKPKERLETVLPLRAGTSLFVFRDGSGVKPPAYSVFHAAEALSADGLETRLGLRKDRPFLGVHVLGPSAYLLIYADER